MPDHPQPPPLPQRVSQSPIDVDRSGITMSWKTFLGIMAALLLAGGTWTAFSASVITAADLSTHDANPKAHQAIPALKDPVRMSEVQAMLKPIEDKAASNTELLLSVRNGFYEQRAEALALKAVESMSARASQERKLSRFVSVREQAMHNLENDVPPEQGIRGLRF